MYVVGEVGVEVWEECGGDVGGGVRVGVGIVDGG